MKSPYASKPWLKHYDPGVPATIKYHETPLHKMLENSVAFLNQMLARFLKKNCALRLQRKNS